MAIKILWADDEIDLLKPHIMFLEEKGYEVVTVTNGDDAIDEVQKNDFSIIFLDENMPGKSGLETLNLIKSSHPSVPVIMITKSEEEAIMEDAIGKKISDYLIKPVNPMQILLSIKKNLDKKRLVSEQASIGYRQVFQNISMRLSDRLSTDEWIDLYKDLVYWELELQESEDVGMNEILITQKAEANKQFGKFVKSNYRDWVSGTGNDIPMMSQRIVKEKIARNIQSKPLFLVIIDNLRYDQWMVIRPLLREHFNLADESLYYSILPTATQYARNALMAGLMPSEIEKKFPDKWFNDDKEGGKNLHEEFFFQQNLKRLGKDVKIGYEKVTNLRVGKKVLDNFSNLLNNNVNVIVYNFVDMLSHARTDMKMIRELAEDETAYRSLTKSWFEHSVLLSFFKLIAENGCKAIITTDHGTVRVTDPCKVIGDRTTSTNLRYKCGRNLNYKDSEVFAVNNPSEVYLPKTGISTSYIFASGSQYFLYPNNYNHFLTYYKDTFQHGGISMEEMLIPYVELEPK